MGRTNPDRLESAAAWLAGRLAADDLAALERQGFVRGERLPSGASAFKLRFRKEGRQRVVYLGVDAAFAAAVSAELQRRQAVMRRRRALARSVKAARRSLRESRRAVAALLVDAPWQFHGRAFRRVRRRPQLDIDSPIPHNNTL
jgi:hypothetical protein